MQVGGWLLRSQGSRESTTHGRPPQPVIRCDGGGGWVRGQQGQSQARRSKQAGREAVIRSPEGSSFPPPFSSDDSASRGQSRELKNMPGAAACMPARRPPHEMLCARWCVCVSSHSRTHTHCLLASLAAPGRRLSFCSVARSLITAPPTAAHPPPQHAITPAHQHTQAPRQPEPPSQPNKSHHVLS